MTDVVKVAIIAGMCTALPQLAIASIWGFVNLRQGKKNHDAINGKITKLMELQDDKMQEKVVSATLIGVDAGKHQASEKRRQSEGREGPQAVPVNDPEPKE